MFLCPKKVSSVEKSYKFGWPYIKKEKGFFFSNKCNYGEVSKILNNLRLMKIKTWKKKKKKKKKIRLYQNGLMIYDKNNFILKKKKKNCNLFKLN